MSLKKVLLFSAILLILFFANYFFENLYLIINAVLKNTTTYKGNIAIPHYFKSLSPERLVILKISGNATQILLNFLFSYLFLLKINVLKNHRRLFLYTSISMLAIMMFLLAICRFLDLNSYQSILIQTIRSPFIFFILIFFLFLHKHQMRTKYSN